MIVSEETTLNSRLNELKVYLTKHKYPLKLIEDVIAKVHFLDRRTLLSNHKKSEESDRIPYVPTFNPNNPEIYPNIKQGSLTLAMGKCLWFSVKIKSLSIVPFFALMLP